MSVIRNLNEVRNIGIRAYIKKEKLRWICKNCGETICVHEGACLSCGKPVC